MINTGELTELINRNGIFEYILINTENMSLLPEENHTIERCPFCGGKAKFVGYGEEGKFEDWTIECESCHILFIAPGKESGDVTTKEEVATAWNRRHPIVVLDELSSSEEN